MYFMFSFFIGTLFYFLMYFLINVFVFFVCLFRSGIAESHGSSIFIFLRNFYAAFHGGYTNLQSHL